jgi:hypothetical protein
MSFYLTKRVGEKQCTVGERCMVLSDFISINAGKKGTVVEVYDGGVSIRWDKNGEGYSGTDGFSSDELEYLAFETQKHPRIDPTVTRKEI